MIYAPTLIATLVHATLHLSTSLTTRAVTNNSKAGLAWPNGNSVDIKQYTSTGKVSWWVDTEFPGSGSKIFHIQVLHMVSFPRKSQYRVCPHVLGREDDRPMDIDGSENPSKFRTKHNGCFGNERVSLSLPNFPLIIQKYIIDQNKMVNPIWPHSKESISGEPM